MSRKEGVETTVREGIFDHLVDTAAFVDKIEVSELQDSSASGTCASGVISVGESFPIARAGRLYARAVNGVCSVTGNPFQRRYGRLVKLPRVPFGQLVLRSCSTPVSGAQVEFVAKALSMRYARMSVSSVELTFDLTGTSIEFLMQHLRTRARTAKCLMDEQGRKTLYVGARRSPWQMRAYEKAPGILRVEFVFRRAFLRKHGIERPSDLLLLRRIDLTKLMSLRRLEKERIREIEGQNEFTGSFRKRVLCTLARFSTTKEFTRLLKGWGARCPEFFVPCALEQKLRKMQHQMIW